MPPVWNAICVSLSRVYPQVGEAFRSRPLNPTSSPHILHHATAFAWKVNPLKAAHVRYAFGIAAGRVVSAYRIKVPAADWPVMPSENGGPAQGRRVLPLIEVSPEEWALATSWPGVEMNASTRYAHLQTGPRGEWKRLFVPNDSPPDDDDAEGPTPDRSE